MTFESKVSSAVIYDDHKLFAQTFAGFLERLHLFRQVHVAKDEIEARSLVALMSMEYDVYFFLDYLLSGHNSLNLFNDARRSSKRVKIIIVTSLDKPTIIYNLLHYKPNAIISKVSGVQEITECLSEVVKGNIYLCPEISQLMNGYRHDDMDTVFSPREIEILTLFNEGLSIVQAAEAAHLSRYTIVNHRSNMMKKSGTKSIVELLAYARNKGIL